jgi:hypothetical protein
MNIIRSRVDEKIGEYINTREYFKGPLIRFLVMINISL